MATIHQWQQFRRQPTPIAREQLITEYAPLARYVVDRLPFHSPQLPEEDLVGQAVIGLIEAIDRYDPGRGVKFETFAYYRIRGAVMDLAREMDFLPRSMREKQGELNEAYERLLAELGRQPTDQEVAEVLGISVDDLASLHQGLDVQSIFSLDETLAESDGGVVSMVDTIADTAAESPEQAAVGEAERELLARAIDGLPEMDRQVVSLYYHEGLTMKEIGLVLGVTESRVCQIHSKALARLRAAVASEERLPCL